MEKYSLTNKAIVFAICAGAVAFILALAAGSQAMLSVESATRGLIVAIICSVMCWASAERTIASTATALDQAIERLSEASEGDLDSPIPADVSSTVPQLAKSMDILFRRLRDNLDEVERLALYDPVTGLPNRLNFRRNCEAMIGTTRPDLWNGLLFIDLDRFKQVNDTLGHAFGDTLLAMVADRLRAIVDAHVADGVTTTPLIGRLAGDEFTIFLPDIDDPELPRRIGDEILAQLEQPFVIVDQTLSIGASVGVAIHPDHGTSLIELMRAADAAMYRAKKLGRGRTEQFDSALAAEIAERAAMDRALRKGIDDQEFALVFQPQIDARTGQVTAAEALLRWRHPDGLKLPGAFIRQAEENGLIVEIGDWVVESVADTIRRWSAAGAAHRMAINVSARQLQDASFFRALRDHLHKAGAPASMLELEITESLAMTCDDEIIEAIAALRSDGATVAIDDFGTGYSNLARLRDLPVDCVKLDRSLVEHVIERDDARIIAHAVIGLIHGLGCKAVAEGIESPAQAEVLRIIGCDMLQGYAIAPPMEEPAFLEWSNRQRRAAVNQ